MMAARDRGSIGEPVIPLVECYSDKERLGKGASGVVYSYVADKIPSADLPAFFWPIRVAVKKIPIAEENDQKNFQREVESLKGLKHKHIVAFLGLVQPPNTINEMWLVMKLYVPDLRKLIETKRRKPLDDWEIAFIIKQIVDAVAYIHGKKTLHRDLKPSNILFKTDRGIEPDWETVDVRSLIIKVADFGLSRPYQSDGTQYTLTGNVGTEGFQAPEILTGHYKYPADIFSVGAIAKLLRTRSKQNNSPGVNASLVGGFWSTEEFSFAFTMFLHATLQSKKEDRPSGELLLKHPFLSEEEKKVLCMLDVAGGIRAIDSTDDFFLARCNNNMIYAIDALKLNKLVNITESVTSDESDVTSLSAYGSSFAIGMTSGAVQVWTIRRKRGEHTLKMECNYDTCEEGGKEVAWIAMNRLYVVTTGADKMVRIYHRRREEIAWSLQLETDPAYRLYSIILSQYGSGEDETSVLTLAEASSVRQFSLRVKYEPHDVAPKSRFKKYKVGKEVIGCICLDSPEVRAGTSSENQHHLVWMACHPPHSVMQLVDLQQRTVLKRFRILWPAKQIMAVGDMLLCHVQDFAVAFDLADIPSVKRGSKTREEGRQCHFREFAKFDTVNPRLYCLNDRYILHGNKDHSLTFSSLKKIKEIPKYPQRQSL